MATKSTTARSPWILRRRRSTIFWSPERREPNSVTGSSVSLVGICDDVNVNRDTLFLEQIQNVLDNFERSDTLMPFRNQVKVTRGNARGSLKKEKKKDHKN